MMNMTQMKLVNSATKFRHGMDKFYQPNSGLRSSRSLDEAIYTYILWIVYVYFTCLLYTYVYIYTHVFYVYFPQKPESILIPVELPRVVPARSIESSKRPRPSVRHRHPGRGAAENGTKQQSTTHTGWWLGTFGLFFHILGISSSQLTNSYFSEGLTNSKRLHDCGKSLFSIGRSTISTGPFSMSQTVSLPDNYPYIVDGLYQKNRVNLEMVYGFTKNLT